MNANLKELGKMERYCHRLKLNFIVSQGGEKQTDIIIENPATGELKRFVYGGLNNTKKEIKGYFRGKK